MCHACFDPWENLPDAEQKLQPYELSFCPKMNTSECSEVKKCLSQCLLNSLIHFTTLKALTLLHHIKTLSHMQSSEVNRFLNGGN